MLSFRPRRVALGALLALGSLAGFLAPAQAAVTSGEAKAGNGGFSCGGVVSCTTFDRSCNATVGNDIDASVRSAGIGNQWHPVTWNATLTGPTPPLGYLMIQPFNSACDPIGNAISVGASGAQALFPGGTAYIAAWPVDRFVNFTFTVH